MVAYVSRLNYPDPAANALQTLRMAAALSEQAGSTGLFVHDLAVPEESLRQQYGVGESPLKIWSLRAGRWPSRLYNQGLARFLLYNSGVALTLGLHPQWRRAPEQGKVLFVRSRLETLYWGSMRPYLPWLRDWVFVCEMHDLPDPAWADPAWADPGGEAGGEEHGAGPAADSSRARRMARALENYDLVIAVTRGLAEELRDLTGERVKPEVVPLCTGLPRLDEPPRIASPSERVVLGYTGTVDLDHGVDHMLEAMARLPEKYVLRIAGRVREDVREQVEAACRTGRAELLGQIPYAQIEAEIDACHIALVPAGKTAHATRYRSPLKIFDYMARGKPVLAADAPCHRELLQDGANAVLYRNGDPEDLAAKIRGLSENPQRMSAIACEAWRASSAHTYPARAAALLELFDQARERTQSRKQARNG